MKYKFFQLPTERNSCRSFYYFFFWWGGGEERRREIHTSFKTSFFSPAQMFWILGTQQHDSPEAILYFIEMMKCDQFTLVGHKSLINSKHFLEERD